jgi:hypothetical protein
MCVAILAGRLYGACENEAFSQVSLKPPTRFSHCAHRAPMRTTKPNFFLNFYPMKKIQSMKKFVNPLIVFLMQIIGHQQVLEWCEREHEEDNAMAQNHPPTIASLRDCGLLNYFLIPGMRDQVKLLEYLVRMWYPDQQVFHVGVHTLSLDIEDI